MKLIIKHIDIAYVDITTFDDPEPDLAPSDVDVHYEMIQAQSVMPGKITIPFNVYEGLNHRELAQYLEQEQQRHLQAFQLSNE